MLIDTNDDLKNTKYFDNRLKGEVKKLEKLLVRSINKQYTIIYNNNPELVHNLLNKVEALVEKLSSCQIDDLAMINTVIDNYLKNPNWFLENVDPEFIPLNND